VAARWPWNTASRSTSLVENIDGMPEDDDMNYPLIALSFGKGIAIHQRRCSAAWLGAPAGRVFTAERAAYRNLPSEWIRRRRRATEPVPAVDGAQIRTEPTAGRIRAARPRGHAGVRRRPREPRATALRRALARAGAAAMVESDVDPCSTPGCRCAASSRFAEAVRRARHRGC
jgi:hypothetical protein